MLTTPQIKNRTKTVTRRMGWRFLKIGDVLNACEKCMGLKEGQKIVKLGRIRVVNVYREKLFKISLGDCIREGFPEMDPAGFIRMFCESHKGCTPQTEITRIEFEYLD